MRDIEIIPIEVSHIDEVVEIENLSFSLPWSRNSFMEEITKNKYARYLTAKIGEKVVGYAGMWKIIDEGHITNIAVHPEYRSQGVGKALLESIIRLAKSEKILRITLEVRKSNIIAQALYLKYGFKVEGIRYNYYEDNGEDALIMWADIID